MTCSNQLDNLISDLNNLSINSGLITLSQKDRQMLSLGGYFFRISHQSDKKISWRCTEQHCKAKCSTKACEIGKEYFVTFKNENDRVHIHGQKNSLLDIKEKRRKIKEVTSNIAPIVPNVPHRQILSSFANEIKNKESVALMPTYEADRQVINRIKKKVRPEYPPEPTSLADITLPDFLTVTLEGENGETKPFLIYDSGVDDLK